MRLSKRTSLMLVLSLALVPLVALQGTVQAAPDRTINLASGSQSWSGPAADGANQNYNSATGEPCPETPTGLGDYCDQTLLHVIAGNPANVEVSLADDPLEDYDLYIYNSNANAARGTLVDSSANPQTLLEVATITGAPHDSYYLIQVVYFQTFAELGGYTGTAEITGVGEPPPPPAPDLPTTTYYFHEDGPPPPPADPGTFDTTAPTSPTSSVAVGTQGVGLTPQPRWTGNIPLGVIRRLKVDFFQTTFQEGLFGTNYEVSLIVGSRRYDFPFFTASPRGGVPGRVTHTFLESDPGTPLPITFPGGPVTIEIAGHFINAEAQYEIYYDSVNHPSNFIVNPPPRAFPPDVDSPPGLQEILASDPSQGWTSRSEMHIAQNPVNPNMLIAGSKFYNKDADALAEYEFKVGSYVSFDRGRSWHDLGQVRTAPATAACAQGWPNNTCYPADDPAVDNDVGEQYITSDPWVGWDDEGNAYYMLLDSPPFEPPPQDPDGRGWGMSMHRWDSVSLADLTASNGETWGPKKIISAYQTLGEQALLLDDKNTFAVNNAGPNGDGQSGILVACWGLNQPDLLKQAEVCRRSTDKGETWPVTFERVVNDAEQLGIGISVIADKFDPNTFYAAYLQYVTSLPGEDFQSTIEFNKTVDAGTTFSWGPSTPVATIDDIPRQFPDQSFRNLSIPIMAAGNRVGSPPMSELYITWAEDRVIGSNSANKEAEIALVRSDNAGATWTGFGTPPNHVKIVNGPDNDRDQFQPNIDVTPRGQVNVLYFDRRHDPNNYYVDTFLSRSNDRGVTFRDVRLSHDATDPEYNAPISPSGKFFGDYQGLVADNCFAYPFVNDTHLANDAFLDPGPGPRDPDYDFGMPASPYQEAITWRVPNFAAFGGNAAHCPTSRPRSIPN